jgi:hypothetical protein
LNAPLAVDLEIIEEKVSALGRIARAFEKELDRFRRFQSNLQSAAPRDRPKREAEYEAGRKRLAGLLWYLIVQREAMGLRNHDIVYQVYQIPRSVQPVYSAIV